MIKIFGYVAFVNNDDYTLNVSPEDIFKGGKIKQKPKNFPVVYQRILSEPQDIWISCDKEELLQMCYVKREQVDRAIKILEVMK